MLRKLSLYFEATGEGEKLSKIIGEFYSVKKIIIKETLILLVGKYPYKSIYSVFFLGNSRRVTISKIFY